MCIAAASFVCKVGPYVFRLYVIVVNRSSLMLNCLLQVSRSGWLAVNMPSASCLVNMSAETLRNMSQETIDAAADEIVRMYGNAEDWIDPTAMSALLQKSPPTSWAGHPPAAKATGKSINRKGSEVGKGKADEDAAGEDNKTGNSTDAVPKVGKGKWPAKVVGQAKGTAATAVANESEQDTAANAAEEAKNTGKSTAAAAKGGKAAAKAATAAEERANAAAAARAATAAAAGEDAAEDTKNTGKSTGAAAKAGKAAAKAATAAHEAAGEPAVDANGTGKVTRASAKSQTKKAAKEEEKVAKAKAAAEQWERSGYGYMDLVDNSQSWAI